MDEIDIIIKTYDDFISVKSNPNILNNELLEKYNKLFGYDCFSNKIIYKDKPYRCLNDKNDKKNFRNRERDNRRKPIERVILGILNIINNDNYDKILNKLRLVATEENITNIINEILNKCCSQFFFMKVFLKLIIDLVNVTGYHEIMMLSINNFIDSFVINNEYLYIKNNVEDKNKKTDYDNFCNDQKHKSYTLAKNLLIFELLKTGICRGIDIDRYILYFFDNLKNTIAEDNYHNDLLLNILLDILKQNNVEIQQDIYIELYDYFLEYKNIVSSKKIEFLIVEILDLIKIK
jgi:hypothetical protein